MSYSISGIFGSEVLITVMKVNAIIIQVPTKGLHSRELSKLSDYMVI